MDERVQKLTELLNQTANIVPAMVFMGRTPDNKITLFMSSSERDSKDKEVDIGYTVIMLMMKEPSIRNILLNSVSYYLTKDIDEWIKVKHDVESHLYKRRETADGS